mmetsp:Transcript_34161/g.85737  ORF Transcript_34161/g.85737 Transcript_34161/m.85737 type:complete len:248 (+) Transcript_34161:2970-3713(+)
MSMRSVAYAPENSSSSVRRAAAAESSCTPVSAPMRVGTRRAIMANARSRISATGCTVLKNISSSSTPAFSVTCLVSSRSSSDRGDDSSFRALSSTSASIWWYCVATAVMPHVGPQRSTSGVNWSKMACTNTMLSLSGDSYVRCTKSANDSWKWKDSTQRRMVLPWCSAVMIQSTVSFLKARWFSGKRTPRRAIFSTTCRTTNITSAPALRSSAFFFSRTAGSLIFCSDLSELMSSTGALRCHSRNRR